MHPGGEVEVIEPARAENSPILEHSEEGNSSPQREYTDDDLLKITREVQKKDQSRKMVLWEKNEIRN